MINVDLYVNRSCPRDCAQCMAREVKLYRPILRPDEWNKVMSFIEDEFGGVGFYQNLGIESLFYPWIIDWIRMMNENERNYTLYTTFPPQVMKEKFVKELIKVEPTGFAGGTDYTPNMPKEVLSKDYDQLEKTLDVVNWSRYFMREGVVKDIEFTVTLNKRNFRFVKDIVSWLSEQLPEATIGIAIVHWSADGKHDLFPKLEVMEDYAITPDIANEFKRAMYEFADWVRDNKEVNVVVPPTYIRWLGDYGWKLKFKPMDCDRQITLEADGRFRLCLYRAGEQINEFTIFDVMNNKISWDNIFEMMYKEAIKCPGCAWNCRWTAKMYGDEAYYIEHNRKWWEKIGIR